MTKLRTLEELHQRVRFRETRLRFLPNPPPSVVAFERKVIGDLRAQLDKRHRQLALCVGEPWTH